MMSDYHIVLGIASVVIGAFAYVPYIRDIFRGTTKPHPFTFLVFAILNGIVFFGQEAAHGGPGAWASGITVVGVSFLAIAGFFTSEKYVRPIDYLCLAGALVGVALWLITHEPLAAVVIATLTDLVAFTPTIRKAYVAPNTETASLYVLGNTKILLSIFALDSFNLTTALFPSVIFVVNVLFLGMLFVRRNQLSTVAQCRR